MYGPYWEAFRARHPQWALRIRHNPFVDAFGPLRRGEIDVLVAWLPVEEPDLTVGPVIYTEHAVALVAHDHELAVRPSVSLEVFGDFGIWQGPAGPDYWADAFTPFQTPAAARSNATARSSRAWTTCSPRSAPGTSSTAGRPRHPLPRTPRHRLSAHSRLARPALGPGLAQRHRVRPRPGACPGRGGLGYGEALRVNRGPLPVRVPGPVASRNAKVVPRAAGGGETACLVVLPQAVMGESCRSLSTVIGELTAVPGVHARSKA
ncbi:LysR substrate-binding domain-containing protein [Streptomyces wuyuanensis]|uniref:LysR substrate-binding domain-containing protein n=1 Tax=Streptomyces wuyuanensis TaxID=1196353 RepID=UPI0036B28C91